MQMEHQPAGGATGDVLLVENGLSATAQANSPHQSVFLTYSDFHQARDTARTNSLHLK